MKFISTTLPSCFEIEMSPLGDERGYFMRTFCQDEFEKAGLNSQLVQASISFNRDIGTLRALHFQAHPHMEDRLVRCLAGAIYDVAVDLRPGSATFGKWHAAELSEGNNRQLYVPKGFAHGFQTLAPDTIVSYQMSEAFQAELTSGLRWDDPDVGVDWPLPPSNQSERDLGLPFLGQLDQSTLQPFDAEGSAK